MMTQYALDNAGQIVEFPNMRKKYVIFFTH